MELFEFIQAALGQPFSFHLHLSPSLTRQDVYLRISAGVRLMVGIHSSRESCTSVNGGPTVHRLPKSLQKGIYPGDRGNSLDCIALSLPIGLTSACALSPPFQHVVRSPLLNSPFDMLLIRLGRSIRVAIRFLSKSIF